MFPRPSEEVRRLAALLADEMLRWPGVRLGSMFGMISVYRGKTIFAFLPGKRSLFAANAISIKHNNLQGRPGEKWTSFELEDESSLRDALRELDAAYLAAK
jgi:hypothetical protein